MEVVGVGDTCSFAQMDVRQHGHPAVSPSEIMMLGVVVRNSQIVVCLTSWVWCTVLLCGNSVKICKAAPSLFQEHRPEGSSSA